MHPPPPRRRRKRPWVLLAAAVVFFGGIIAIAAVVRGDAGKSVTVRYRVTGTARDVTIGYPTWHDDTISTTKVTAKTLPWQKELTTKSFVKGGSLSLTLGPGGGTATCSVVVDNGKAHTATATGPSATVDCNGF
ncbi:MULTISPECIES: hypothetical protein [unclassified Streptomyces]|uniref:hypothetical protein n=1 Tax=unclassified Streptomyces TaxID=2593676 RepID=UPI002E20135C